MTNVDPEWASVWAGLRAAVSLLPRCQEHPDLPSIETLDQKVVNDILTIGIEGIRVRSHRTENERLLPEKAFRKWWRLLKRDGHVKIRPGLSPFATNSVIYAAFFIRCLPDLVIRGSDGDLQLTVHPFPPTLTPVAALPDDEPSFIGTDIDLRPVIERQIRARRGQQQFRNALIERYGPCCMVTGCTVLDVIEAAHIKPYRGANDHHPENGLLLRADIHTLFDLNLIGILETLSVSLKPAIDIIYKSLVSPKLLLTSAQPRPSAAALASRYRAFCVSV